MEKIRCNPTLRGGREKTQFKTVIILFTIVLLCFLSVCKRTIAYHCDDCKPFKETVQRERVDPACEEHGAEIGERVKNRAESRQESKSITGATYVVSDELAEAIAAGGFRLRESKTPPLHCAVRNHLMQLQSPQTLLQTFSHMPVSPDLSENERML